MHNTDQALPWEWGLDPPNLSPITHGTGTPTTYGDPWQDPSPVPSSYLADWSWLPPEAMPGPIGPSISELNDPPVSAIPALPDIMQHHYACGTSSEGTTYDLQPSQIVGPGDQLYPPSFCAAPVDYGDVGLQSMMQPYSYPGTLPSPGHHPPPPQRYGQHQDHPSLSPPPPPTIPYVTPELGAAFSVIQSLPPTVSTSPYCSQGIESGTLRHVSPAAALHRGSSRARAKGPWVTIPGDPPVLRIPRTSLEIAKNGSKRKRFHCPVPGCKKCNEPVGRSTLDGSDDMIYTYGHLQGE
ncbi:hypothetical protein FKP32DRAFT_1674971 [Trametes sanguinea]|nr:hypothetical protein FKP32DRAFT_1674971 [Trametes sanguinea]